MSQKQLNQDPFDQKRGAQRHLAFWPEGLPHNITVPATNLFYNVEVSAARYPD